MPKENMGDKIIDKLNERRDLVRGRLNQEYKSVKPFRMEPVDNNELLFYYNQLTQDDMNFLISSHGEEKINQFIFEMYQLQEKAKRRVN